MRYALVMLLVAGSIVVAKERVVTETVIKPDTIVTIKIDTIKTVRYDTLKITKKVNDTSIVVKTDTVKSEGKKPGKK